GIVVAAPVGPVNLICIHRTVKLGRRAALGAAVGAVIGDGIFALSAALGLSEVLTRIGDQQALFRVLGGILVLCFAVSVWRSARQSQRADGANHISMAERSGPAVALMTFGMTISNPATMMGFAALFAAIGFHQSGGDGAVFVANASALTGGVVLGSILWWSVLTAVIDRLKRGISDDVLMQVNRASAVLLAFLGVGALSAGFIS
ncbi:MAG: LysE family transporter, partial [Pseudomonadota bacterium]